MTEARPLPADSQALRAVSLTRVGRERAEQARDSVIVEEPLEIRVNGNTLAITMRTPGNDRELVMGFLFAEGVIAGVDDVLRIEHCDAIGGAVADEDCANTIDVSLSARLALKVVDDALMRRGTLTTSACGVCGRRTIDDLLARCQPVISALTMRSSAIAEAANALRAAQTLFARSGGCHGAALVDPNGALIAAFEDVGRHNAVDKLIGARLFERALPAHEHALIVSGRTSFEIVQKAVAAGIPIVAGISAASSLAIDTAERGGVTLVGFVRGGEMVVYTHAGRITELHELTPR